MKYLPLLIILMLVISCQKENKETPRGQLINYESVLSKYVQPRNVTIWLPPAYDKAGSKNYPVIYMQDGQNLFDTATATFGVEWQVDKTMSKLIHENKVEPAIVVGIWNTNLRTREYTPEKPFELLSESMKKHFADRLDTGPLSDEYLKFLVKELKPFVDENFYTKPNKGNTFIAGSSMGGLISLYAITEYPDVFGKAACISTHWPLGFEEGQFDFTEAMITYLDSNYSALQDKSLYFDYGTETLDSMYEPHQKMIDNFFQKKGFSENQIITRKYEGHKHHESSWAERFDVIARFLVGK